MTAQDKELFSQLYDRNYKRLLYAAIRIAHNPFTAEELTNEAFTILLTHFDRVRQHPNLPGWLHTVLTNLALDEYKRQSRYVQVPLDSVQNLGCEPAFLSMLDLLPNELSRTDKVILYLRYQLNLNCVDIAEYLHISHEASRARLSRAKSALRPPACEGTADVSFPSCRIVPLCVCCGQQDCTIQEKSAVFG